MLPKENRLTEKGDFQLLFKKGDFLRGRFVNFFYSVSPSQTVPQFGFVVSNKVSKLAVERNRLKRILRAEAYFFLKRKPEWRGAGVFVALRQAAGSLVDDVAADCRVLLGRV